MHKSQTLEHYLHAHINIKHANKMQNSKKKKIEVRLKSNLQFIYAYEPSQKLAYLRDEIEMHRLPKIRSFSFQWKLTKGAIEVMKICTLNYWLKLQRF